MHCFLHSISSFSLLSCSSHVFLLDLVVCRFQCLYLLSLVTSNFIPSNLISPHHRSILSHSFGEEQPGEFHKNNFEVGEKKVECWCNNPILITNSKKIAAAEMINETLMPSFTFIYLLNIFLELSSWRQKIGKDTSLLSSILLCAVLLKFSLHTFNFELTWREGMWHGDLFRLL